MSVLFPSAMSAAAVPVISIFRRNISHFWVSVRSSCLAINFRRSSALYKLCVNRVPSQAVRSRGGFYVSNDHRDVFYFACEKSCYLDCFDTECPHTGGCRMGPPVFAIPQDAVETENSVFRILRS